MDSEPLKKDPQSAWDEAIANGAVTVDVFIDELKTQIGKWYAEHPHEQNGNLELK